MIRQFAAAIAFLTRLPAPSRMAFDAKDIGRSARWFPLIGLMIGGFLVAALQLFTLVFPPLVTAFLIAAIDALLTGALHLDGLADTADGFGGGRTREDVLRIMRDHAIGSYGAVALIFVIAIKASCAGGDDRASPRGCLAGSHADAGALVRGPAERDAALCSPLGSGWRAGREGLFRISSGASS